MNAWHVEGRHTIGWIGRLRILICRLGGHELLRSFEPGRVFLQCTSCSYETPGWTLKDARQTGEQPRRRPSLVAQNAR
jgi:hypothetical protein